MGKKLAGTCYVKANAQQITITGGVECPLMDVKRETIMASGGAAGFSETAQAPYVKVTALKVPGSDLASITKATNLTVTVEYANGDVYTLSDAWVQGEPVHKGDDGTVDLEFGGMRGSWA